MSGPRHYCGVVGITAGHNVVAGLQKALMIIQHRGQDSAGISVFDGNAISTVKDAGLVQTALPKERIENLNGKRYERPADDHDHRLRNDCTGT